MGMMGLGGGLGLGEEDLVEGRILVTVMVIIMGCVDQEWKISI